jgi:predicted enzyme related to lactoylglutathione lyase
MNNRDWVTIPVLKYIDVDATLTFWETLGFKITFRQDRPYKYAVIEHKGCQLHFYYNKNVDISTPANGCLIIVSDAKDVYQEFSSLLKNKTGRVPSSGLPRISRMKPMQTRFTITDPSGNAVILIQNGGKDKADYEGGDQSNLSDFGKSIALAVRLRDFKEDFPAAAKMLDNALKRQLDRVKKDEQVEALIMRAELARVLNDQNKTAQCYELLAVLDVSAEKILELKSKHNYTN